MRTSRIYYPEPLSTGIDIELESQAAIHLIRVLRAKTGTDVIIFNGDGNEYQASISRIERKRAWVKISHCIKTDRESPLNITLAQGISRSDRMDYTLQKAVELGVTRINPLFTEHCSVQLKADRIEKRLKHWQGIIISACEQSGRTRIPEISFPVTFDQWLENIPPEQTCLTLQPDASDSLQTINLPENNILLLVGPEGGLSQNEIRAANKQDFQGIRLGPRILRTETAALVAMSIIQLRRGDLS